VEAGLATSSFDREGIATLLEISARWHFVPLVGLGAKYASLDTGQQFRGDIIGVGASIHPATQSLLDPYFDLSGVYIAGIDGTLQERAHIGRAGAEGALGLNLVFSNFAIGWDLRYGRSSHEWYLLGMHLEGRL
jgi:hypothetical protein